MFLISLANNVVRLKFYYYFGKLSLNNSTHAIVRVIKIVNMMEWLPHQKYSLRMLREVI